MNLTFSRQALKELRIVGTNTALSKNVYNLLELLEKNPFQSPPPFEKLSGDLHGMYSRRINRQHRLVYTVEGSEVKVLSLWTHYENV